MSVPLVQKQPFLRQGVNLGSFFKEIAKRFSKVIAQFDLPPQPTKAFQLLHILANIWCHQSLILVMLVSMKCTSKFQFFISSMSNDVKHFFMC